MNWYLEALKKYAVFDGRARRMEYWMFALFSAIFGFGAALLDNILGLDIGRLSYGPIYIIYSLAVFLPGLAVAVRRLHDVGKSGAMVLLSFIPIIGGIWLFVLMVSEGIFGGNHYGPDPKQVTE